MLVRLRPLCFAAALILAASWVLASPAGARSRVGAWQGATKSGGYVTFDVRKGMRGKAVSRVVVFYRCRGQNVYSTFERIRIRHGRFGGDSGLTSIKGRFRSGDKVRGRVDPAPELLGCTGKAKPFRARFAGKRLPVAVGEYGGTDTSGNPTTVDVGAYGRVITQFAVGGDVEVSCGPNTQHGIIRSDGAPIHPNGAFGYVSPRGVEPFPLQISGQFAPGGTVSGSYSVPADSGCSPASALFNAALSG